MPGRTEGGLLPSATRSVRNEHGERLLRGFTGRKHLSSLIERHGVPSRRRVLAQASGLGATATLGGCLWNLGGASSRLAIRFEPVSRADLGREAVVTASELQPRARRVVHEGLGNGTAVYGRKPRAFADHAVVSVDGTYYAVGVVENGSETVERPVLEAELVDTTNGSVSDWGNLSRSDALTLRCAVSVRDDGDDHSCVVYDGDASAFWPEPRFRYLERGDDGYFRLSVAERAVSLDRYEYGFDRVAANESAFADYAARELVAVDFDEADLSAKQRAIVETAASEGVYEESPPYSEGVQVLADRLRNAGDGVDAYVRFDGSYYLASVRQSFN